MKNIKKMLILILCVILCLSLFGCGDTHVSENENVSPLDTILTETEQKEYSEFVEGVDFPRDTDNFYYQKKESVNKLSEIGIKGLPMLIIKSTENEDWNAAKESREQNKSLGTSLSHDRLLTATALMRIHYSDIFTPNNGVVKPSDNYYTYWEYVKEKLPEIADSDMTAEEKVSAYRKFGIFAVPYVMEEIEAGNTELEPFFALIGTHLTTAEYMQLTDRIDPTKYTGTPPPTEEEIDAILIEGAKDFDYKKWYAENKTDIENLEKFLDAYCAEYEAEKVEE